MNEQPDDNDLKQRFLEFWDEAGGVAPPFSALSQGSPHSVKRRAYRNRRNVLIWTTVGVAVAAVMLPFVLGKHGVTELRDPGFRAAVWEAPTDFLMEAPGGGLFLSLPAIGVGLPGLDRWNPQTDVDNASS